MPLALLGSATVSSSASARFLLPAIFWCVTDCFFSGRHLSPLAGAGGGEGGVCFARHLSLLSFSRRSRQAKKIPIPAILKPRRVSPCHPMEG